MEIPCGVVGVILNSDKSGHNVRVVDDGGNTGSYLVFEWWHGSNGLNDAGAFDAWVEDQASLLCYFQEMKWQIQWLT